MSDQARPKTFFNEEQAEAAIAVLFKITNSKVAIILTFNEQGSISTVAAQGEANESLVAYATHFYEKHIIPFLP